MAETMGKTGTVVDVLATSGDVRVKFSPRGTFLFNPRVRFVSFQISPLLCMCSTVDG